MKRLSILLAACAAALVLPAAAAALTPLHAPVKAREAGHAARAAGPIDRAPLRYVPLARTLTGTATVKVHAYDYSSNPYQAAEVDWWVTTDTDQASGYGYTDSAGLATFTAVPKADPGQGEVAVFPASGDVVYDVWNLSWPEPGGTDMGLQPGKVGIQLTAGGDWSDYVSAWVDVYSSNGDGQQYTGSSVLQSGGVTAATPLALQGDLQGAAVYFWSDQGAEVSLSGLTASASGTTASGLNIDQVDSPTVYNFTWASGKPGSAAKISFKNFPVGWVNDMFGQSDAASSSGVKNYSDWTSPGGTGWTSRKFTVPTTAKPGFNYNIYASHTAGPLTLSEPFQVCSLNPSSAVAWSRGIVMSGRVPFRAGGSSKRVLLYRRYTSGGQPQYVGGFSSYKGWKLIKHAHTYDNGHYRSNRFWPTRTAWYCLWYPKDRDHWGAWTSVTKVTVR